MAETNVPDRGTCGRIQMGAKTMNTVKLEGSATMVLNLRHMN